MQLRRHEWACKAAGPGRIRLVGADAVILMTPVFRCDAPIMRDRRAINDGFVVSVYAFGNGERGID